MSFRYKAGFIQEFFNPLSVGPNTVFPLYAWGDNSSGQLGQNDIVYRSSPVQVGSETNWVVVSCGSQASSAIKTNGTLWGWGYNGDGQLGLNDVINRSSPVQVGSLTTWSNASFGTTSLFAIKTDKTLWIWGSNNFGQLGQNDAIARSSPVQVGALTNWSSVSCGASSHVSAIKTDGTLWVWGQNNYGQLGLNDVINRSSPVQVGSISTWSFVYSGSSGCVYAIKLDGTLWGCGFNLSGNIGNGDVINKSSPVQIGLLTTWTAVSSSAHTMATQAY